LSRCRVCRPEDGDGEEYRQGKAAGSLCIQVADHGHAGGTALGSGRAARLNPGSAKHKGGCRLTTHKGVCTGSGRRSSQRPRLIKRCETVSGRPSLPCYLGAGSHQPLRKTTQNATPRIYSSTVGVATSPPWGVNSMERGGPTLVCLAVGTQTPRVGVEVEIFRSARFVSCGGRVPGVARPARFVPACNAYVSGVGKSGRRWGGVHH
jgi:hypothetical protein